MNAAARLIYSSSRFDHITPLLRQLRWSKSKERIDFKLAVLVYKCMHGTAPPYLADELSRSADSQARYRLRSASPSSLVVRRTCLPTVGDRSFPVAASWIWNGLPQHVTVAPSLTVFRSHLKTHLFRIFSLIFIYMYSACEMTTVILDTLIGFYILFDRFHSQNRTMLFQKSISILFSHYCHCSWISSKFSRHFHYSPFPFLPV